MLVSLDWLKQYIGIPDDVPALAEKMTMLGLEIEAIHHLGAGIDGVVVGEIKVIEPHPDADRLVVCKTHVGEEAPLQIVCGATNMKVGDKVPTAVVGATLPGDFKIGKRKMRGVESQGMMCSSKELNLGEDHSGLMILPPDAPIGEDAKEVLGLNDTIVEIEITPNRGDWASMIGVARELAAAYRTDLRIPAVDVPESDKKAGTLSSVTIEAPDLCPRYAGRVIENVTVGPSPLWLTSRLIAAGQRPINNVVDITNYVLLETGQPLHAFDYEKLAENRIVVRTALDGETILTLDGEERTLSHDMLVIADAERPVAVAGVMGGEESEVGEGTTRIFLESAYFNPTSIRRTARALSMQTEASQHFQRGADPEMVVYAINRAAALMAELCGAEVAAGVLDEYPKRVTTTDVTLRYARTNALLGATVSPEDQRDHVSALGFKLLQESDTGATFRTPTWRHDVAHETDLIEEIARLHGYDVIEEALPTVRKGETEFAPEDRRARQLRNYLVGHGLTEVVHWTFSSKEDVEQAGFGPPYTDMVTLTNPLSERQATMRSTIAPGLLANASYNLRHGRKSPAIFELGPVYKPVAEELLPNQYTHVAVLLSGLAQPPHWSRPAEPVSFYDLKGICDLILDSFGEDYTLEEGHFGPLAPNKSGYVRMGNTVAGYLGEVRKQVLDSYDIDQPVFLLELDLTQLLAKQIPPPQYEEVPKYPPSTRDMAVIVDNAVPAGSLQSAAEQAGGATLQDVEIFDVYRGDPIPDGKKSVALNLVFQAADRTLRDEETQKTWEKILRRLQQDFRAELR